MAAAKDGKGLGLERLQALPTIRAGEFANWGQPETGVAHQASGDRGGSPFQNEREYRFCKAVIENPFQPSSSYAKLAGMSTKTALVIRQRLLAVGFLREQKVDTGRRGRSTIQLEPLSAGIEAVAQHEQAGRNRP